MTVVPVGLVVLEDGRYVSSFVTSEVIFVEGVGTVTSSVMVTLVEDRLVITREVSRTETRLPTRGRAPGPPTTERQTSGTTPISVLTPPLTRLTTVTPTQPKTSLTVSPLIPVRDGPHVLSRSRVVS